MGVARLCRLPGLRLSTGGSNILCAGRKGLSSFSERFISLIHSLLSCRASRRNEWAAVDAARVATTFKMQTVTAALGKQRPPVEVLQVPQWRRVQLLAPELIHQITLQSRTAASTNVNHVAPSNDGSCTFIRQTNGNWQRDKQAPQPDGKGAGFARQRQSRLPTLNTSPLPWPWRSELRCRTRG